MLFLLSKRGGAVMNSLRLQLLAFLAVLAILPSMAGAQDWGEPWSDPRDRPTRLDMNASVGAVAPTDWSDLVLLGSISPVSGVLEQVLVRDLRVQPDTVFGGAVTYWRGKTGFRVQGGYFRSSLEIGGTPLSSEPGRDTDVTGPRVNTWFYDVRGTFSLIDYAPDRWALPYAFVGFGGITYDLSRPVSPPLLTFIERAPVGRPDVVIAEDDGRQFLLAVDELSLETVLAVNFGVGTDFRVPMGRGSVGVRLEISDHVARSPVTVRIREFGRFGGLASDSAVRFGYVHHLRATAGLVVQLGR